MLLRSTCWLITWGPALLDPPAVGSGPRAGGRLWPCSRWLCSRWDTSRQPAWRRPETAGTAEGCGRFTLHCGIRGGAVEHGWGRTSKRARAPIRQRPAGAELVVSAVPDSVCGRALAAVLQSRRSALARHSVLLLVSAAVGDYRCGLHRDRVPGDP